MAPASTTMTTATTHSAEWLAESQATVVTIFFALPIPLEICTTAFRLWVKANKTATRRLAFDDYLMILATAMGVIICAIGLAYAPYGIGRHREAIGEDNVIMVRKGDYIFSHFYNFGIGLTKLSVLALYYRIFETPRFRRVIIGTAVFVTAWIVVMEMLMGFACRPVTAWWGGAEGTCVSKAKLTLFTNVTNIVADVWIFAMPVPKIMALQAMRDKRLSLFFLFSVGLGTCILSAVRLSVIRRIGVYDFTWHLVPLALMSVWEPCGGILCANLPLTYRTLKRGVRHVGGTIGRSLRQRSTDREASHSEAELNNNNNNNNFNHDDWARNKRSAPSSSHGSAKKTYELDRYGEGRADTLHVDLASDQDLPGSMSQVHLAR